MHSFIPWDKRGRLYRLLFTLPLFLLILACGGTTPTKPAPAPTGQAEPPEPGGGTTPTQPAPAASIPAEPLAPGDTTRSLVYAGIERSYVLHIPSGYDGTQATPLVLAAAYKY